MPERLRDAIAHAATPWQWQTARRVDVLLFGTVAVVVAMVIRTATSDVALAAKLIRCAVWSCLGYWTLIRPALRARRRWVALHVR